MVVLHFIWQVKRKLFGKPVKDHLMPIFVGKQRGGKTTAIKRLLQPLGDLVGFPADLQFLADERQQFRLTRCYAMFLDEMAKAERVASDVLKNRITTERIAYRVLGVQKLQTGTNNATFIGASNKQVKEIVVDPTGMRRFYQVECLPQMNWTVLEQIDFLAMWTSVEEEAESPLLGQLTQAQARQDQIRAKDSVEDFFERRCVQRDQWIKATALYGHYVEDLKYQGRDRMAFSLTKFGERMKELAGEENTGWKRSDGIKYRVTVERWETDLDGVMERIAIVARMDNTYR